MNSNETQPFVVGNYICYKNKYYEKTIAKYKQMNEKYENNAAVLITKVIEGTKVVETMSCAGLYVYRTVDFCRAATEAETKTHKLKYMFVKIEQKE
jgi:ADP-ribosylglycohydrolase